MEPIVDTITVALASSSLLVWFIVWRRSRVGEPVISAAWRRDVPWRGTHVAVAFFVYLMLPSIGELAVRWKFGLFPVTEPLSQSNPDAVTISWLFVSQTVALAIATGLVVTFLKVDLGAKLADLGLTRRFLQSDVLVGLVAFLAIGPVVTTLSYLLKLAFRSVSGESLQEHPLVETVKAQPNQGVLLWAAVSAVLVAPIVEEFFFRGVLQGWLEKLAHASRVATGRMHARNRNPAAVDEVVQGSDAENSFHSPRTKDDAQLSDVEWQPEPVMVAPMVVSSMFFAFFHIGHGLDPIPLFLLSMVIAYVYQRTHRLLPCIVIHMTLNGLSMLSLWLHLTYEIPLQ